VRELNQSLTVNAPPAVVLDAFFDNDALIAWWKVRRSLCVPRPLGSYALEWESTEWRDDILGRLGGTFHGTVMEFKSGREFFVADAYWLPPDGGAIGPMALEVSCTAEDLADGTSATRVRVTQNGFEEGIRWRRYYELIEVGWDHALRSLKTLLEA
jgi:uncharacterized protein YndB with AHSA1/START domain